VGEGTVIISTDQITLHITPQLHVDVDQSGSVVAAGRSREFKFGELGEGNFAVSEGARLMFIDPDGPHSRKERWELA